MDDTTRRRLIANRSPIQAMVDARPRCEDCGSVLVDRDFRSYWDGQDPLKCPQQWTRDGVSFRDAITPRCCEKCAEAMGCKSV